MNHFVLHDANDCVAVVVVEGVKAGMALNGWIMDEDRFISVQALQDKQKAAEARRARGAEPRRGEPLPTPKGLPQP
jgi:hypothetical protein